MLDFRIHKKYRSSDNMMNGTDIAIALVEVDKLDPKFNQQKFKNIQVSEIDFLDIESIADL